MGSLASFIKQAFVSELEEHPYTVMRNRQGVNGVAYEVRQYSESRWVQVPSRLKNYQQALDEGADKLKQYFDGNNSAKRKMEPSQPMVLHVLRGEYNILCPLLDPSAPNPSDSKITFETMPSETTMFAMHFEGFADDGVWKENAVQLGNALTSTKESTKDSYYCAQYDAKQKLFCRRNEIWLEKKIEEPKSPASSESKMNPPPSPRDPKKVKKVLKKQKTTASDSSKEVSSPKVVLHRQKTTHN